MEGVTMASDLLLNDDGLVLQGIVTVVSDTPGTRSHMLVDDISTRLISVKSPISGNETVVSASGVQTKSLTTEAVTATSFKTPETSIEENGVISCHSLNAGLGIAVGRPLALAGTITDDVGEQGQELGSGINISEKDIVFTRYVKRYVPTGPSQFILTPMPTEVISLLATIRQLTLDVAKLTAEVEELRSK
jgi:hypothetical protein